MHNEIPLFLWGFFCAHLSAPKEAAQLRFANWVRVEVSCIMKHNNYLHQCVTLVAL